MSTTTTATTTAPNTNGPPNTTSTLTFSVPPADGSRAFIRVNADPTTGERTVSVTPEPNTVVIENLRGKEGKDAPTLDTTGFQLFHRPARHTSFASDEEVEREYYPESSELLREITGASRVVLFDHTIRRRRPGVADTSTQTRQPVAQAHVDQTTTSAIARVHRHLPASDAPELLKKRFQIINLWRPISHPALDWPLALCDYRSVNPEKDTFPVQLVYDHREPGETLGVRYGERQRWGYWYGVTPEEIVLIKCFDSVQDGSVAVFTPHTGFEDPATPAGAPARESIELRFLVFYD